jgi:hypothetical protein
MVSTILYDKKGVLTFIESALHTIYPLFYKKNETLLGSFDKKEIIDIITNLEFNEYVIDFNFSKLKLNNITILDGTNYETESWETLD